MGDWVSTLGVAMGSAWLSGINLYATVATLGLLERFGFAHLPGDLQFLGNWWLIGLAGLLYLIEFVADKVPAVDSVWDAIHTFIRVPAGAVLAAAAFGHFNPMVRIAALLLGGGIALGTHGTKAATRAGVNLSPEPFSNIAVSLIEDGVVIGSSLLVATHPIVMIAIVVVFLCIVVWFVPRLLRLLQSVRRGLFGRGPDPQRLAKS